METPSSTQKTTRSSLAATMNSASKCNSNIPLSRKLEGSEKIQSKSVTRISKAALIDITNDSPIVGLAMETPSSAVEKLRKNEAMNKAAHGSGEALLRGQVKTLLQKVEGEAVVPKISRERNNLGEGLVYSPMTLLAPTPANTPHLPNFSEQDVVPSPAVDMQVTFGPVVSDIEDESVMGFPRPLFLDFSDKSDSPVSSICSSVLTCKSTPSVIPCKSTIEKSESTPDDDNSSVWSIQVNASTNDDDDEEETIEQVEGVEGEDWGLVDDLCDGMSRMNVKEKTTAAFEGKHVRFVYDSEGEDIIEEDIDCALRLKGLPTPKGKHFRFGDEEEE